MIKNKKILLLLPLLFLACSTTLTKPIATESTINPTRIATPTNPSTATGTASPETCTVAVENLHLRAEPGLRGKVIAYLRSGDVLFVLPDSPVENWVRVQMGDHTGWINSIYCERK